VNQDGFLIKTVSSLTSTLESVMRHEELSRTRGLFQLLDSRLKVASSVLFIIIVGLARNFSILTAILALVLIISFFSKIPTRYFLKRVLLFIPVFTLVIAVPALFITPGVSLLNVAGVTITEQGARAAGFLFLRVTDSLSLGVLLILTTPWNNLLAALRWFRIPSLLVDILGMTYRYIFLLLYVTNSMFLARRSRSLGNNSSGENRRWLARIAGTTLVRTQHLSEQVYLAMLSRGYQGESRALIDFSFKSRDFLGVVFTLILAAVLLWGNYL
jgi:cobalt/nickel transport system permease protein